MGLAPPLSDGAALPGRPNHGLFRWVARFELCLIPSWSFRMSLLASRKDGHGVSVWKNTRARTNSAIILRLRGCADPSPAAKRRATDIACSPGLAIRLPTPSRVAGGENGPERIRRHASG